jgi:hypothetical protein
MTESISIAKSALLSSEKDAGLNLAMGGFLSLKLQDARTYCDNDQVHQKKKSVKTSYTHFDPAVSKTILCNLNMIFYKFILAGAKFRPSKP